MKYTGRCQNDFSIENIQSGVIMTLTPGASDAGGAQAAVKLSSRDPTLANLARERC
jgi:hypothetical protein